MGGQQLQQHARRREATEPGALDPMPHAPGKRTRVNTMATAPTPATARLEQAIARADGYLDRMFELGPDDPSYKTFAVSVDAIIKSVDSQLRPLEAQRADGPEGEAVRSVRQQLSALESDAVPALQDLLGGGTGFALVDHGPRCEPTDGSSPPLSGCYLQPRQRQYLIAATLPTVVGSAMRNFHMGVLQVRLQEMHRKEIWDFVCELLFGGVRSALIGVAMKALAAVKAAAAAKSAAVDSLDLLSGVENPKTFLERLATVPDRVVSGALGTVIAGARNTVRTAYESSGASEKASRLRFLSIVEAQVKPIGDAIVNTATARLDDVGLVALARTYEDPISNSPDEYAAYAEGLLDKFDRNQIGKLGSDFEGGGRYELQEKDGVYLVVKRHGTGVIGQRTNSIGGRADQYHVIFDDGRVEVVGRVPDELEAIAVQIDEEERIARTVREAQAQAKRDRELKLLEPYTQSAESEQNTRMDRRGR